MVECKYRQLDNPANMMSFAFLAARATINGAMKWVVAKSYPMADR